MSANNSEKVFFVQQKSNGELETESLWCEKKDEYFVIDNIPFIAKRIALGDTIKTEFDESDGTFYFDDFVEVSGNSTIRIFFDEREKIEVTRRELERLGCESEVLLVRKIVAVNVPRDLDYRPVKSYLEHGEKNNLWTYEESCLSHEY
ncbi:DUF4265 domain-containing protein [Chitinophagaceae bacterium LWZ2-11]